MMVLYELGLMNNGMLIYEKKFYKVNDLNRINDETKGQFFDAIVKMTEESMQEKIHCLELKEYKVVFKNTELEMENKSHPIHLLVYAIADTKINLNFSKSLLNKILNIYIETTKKNAISHLYSEKIPENSGFEKKVSEIIGDYYSKSIDRMMKLFS